MSKYKPFMRDIYVKTDGSTFTLSRWGIYFNVYCMHMYLVGLSGECFIFLRVENTESVFVGEMDIK